MSAPYAGSLLAAFVDAFVAKSATLTRRPFNRKTIAARAFDRSPPPESRMARCCSADTGRHLTEPVLQAIVDACRRLLVAQFQENGVLTPESRAAEFERDVCRQLRLSPTGRAQPADFDLTHRLETATTAAEFGLPDVMAWQEGSFSFGDHLRTTQARSVDVMKSLVPYLARTADPVRQLALFGVVLSAAAINHPGTRWHRDMRQRAWQAATTLKLLELATSPTLPPELRSRALSHWTDLQSLSFLPTLDSPSNALQQYALRNDRLGEEVWRAIQPDVEQTLQTTAWCLEFDSLGERSHLCRAAYLSQKARLLAATNHAGHLRDARQLDQLSQSHAERCSYPEGLVFPIQASLVQGNPRDAAMHCEASIERLEHAGRHSAAAAFAALLVQITGLNCGMPTTDPRTRQWAREAIRCPSTRYQYSHIFHAPTVRKLLGPGRPPKTPCT